MDIPAITTALTAARDTDVPTTKAETTSLLKALNADGLRPLRDWLDELVSALDEAEGIASDLADPDKPDREDIHGNLVNSLDALLDELSVLA